MSAFSSANVAEAYIQLQQDTRHRLQDCSSNTVMIQASEQPNGSGLYFGVCHPSTAAPAPPGFQTFLVPNHHGWGSDPYMQQHSNGSGHYFGGGIATVAPAPQRFATAAPPPPGFQTFLVPNQQGWGSAPYMQQAPNGSGLYFGMSQPLSAAQAPHGFQAFMGSNQQGCVPAAYMQQPPTGSGLYFGGGDQNL